jgi:transposase
MLMRYHAGDRRVWTVARIPPPQHENERPLHRELERLRLGCTDHSSRIRSLLVLRKLRTEPIGGRVWARWWAFQAAHLLPAARTEIERELGRLAPVRTQIRALEAQ